MSKDIRSFFQLKKPSKPKIDDDEDVIPESPNVQCIQKKKKESRKKRVLSDSDEETSTKKKKTEESIKSKEKSKTPQKQALKEVKAADMFGSAPLKRTEPIVKKAKRKTETGIHSDDEFDKSLLEVDESLLKEIDHAKPIEPKEAEKNSQTAIKYQKSPNDKEKSSKNKSSNHDTKTNAKKENLDKTAKKENKAKFSEFIDNAATTSKNSEKDACQEKLQNQSEKDSKRKLENDDTLDYTLDDDEQDKKKKKKFDKSLNDSVLTDEERHERKMHSAALYKNYLNRSGPKHLGSKQMPEGTPECLKDTAFLLTGVLDSFDRDEVSAAIMKYGGCIKNGISKKVTHVLSGEEAGPAKFAKAQELGIKILNEDEFLQLIKDRSQNKDIKKEKSPKQSNGEKKSSHKHKKESSHKEVKLEKRNESDTNRDKPNHETLKSSKIIKREKKPSSEVAVDKVAVKSRSESNIKKEDKDVTADVVSSRSLNSHSLNDVKNNAVLSNNNSIMWVDKYKPQNVKQIIGQHGDASNVKKLSNWLTKWYVNRKAKLPKPSPWAKNDDGGYFKAALLSGPPGVGKTTTVSLVCKELGFDMVEFNASDTRNKTLIKEQIGELLSTTSLSGYAKGDTGKQAVTKKHVLVMDEVDGMAGNEDRGGLQELISLIRSTSVPIICMCNDRNSQKMRSFVNYCYDLRFSRPKVEQIKSAMMSICFKEGFKIPPDVLTQLVVAAGQDVRQTLHLLSMWAVDPELSGAERLRKDARNIKKDIKLGPWEAVRKVFSAEEHKTMSINDKSDLFFYDYSLSPLFVQENYLQVAPHCDKKEVLSRISKAAESISAGNLIDSRIRSNQAWSLLPMQAMYSSVIPGHAMSGHVTGQIQFPGWLGKNSRATKMQRLGQQIHAHTRLSTSGSKSSIFLDYCSHLRDAIVTPLIKDKTEGIDKSLEVLEAYHLLREDLDSLTELSLWPGQRNPTVLIDSKVKAAMTRTYNKKASALPYAPGAIKRARTTDDLDDEEDPDEVEPEDSDPENDALIKKKKTVVKSEDAKPSSSKASSKDKSKKKK